MNITVSPETFAAVLAVSIDTIARRVRRGQIPQPDIRKRSHVGWHLSTLKAWNPALATRVERGIQLQIFPATKPPQCRKAA